MTEWNGIKVGRLYKRTGRGSRGAPLVMVVSIEQTYFKPAIIHPSSGDCLASAVEHADVTVLVDGMEEQFALDFYSEHDCVQLQEWKSCWAGKEITEYVVYKPWPYKEVV